MPSPLLIPVVTLSRLLKIEAMRGWLSLIMSVMGPSSLVKSSPLKLLVMFCMPSAALSSLLMMAARSGCSRLSSKAPVDTTGEAGLPKSMAMKF